MENKNSTEVLLDVVKQKAFNEFVGKYLRVVGFSQFIGLALILISFFAFI